MFCVANRCCNVSVLSCVTTHHSGTTTVREVLQQHEVVQVVCTVGL